MTLDRFVPWLAATWLAVLAVPSGTHAQQQSVPAGINAPFEKPDVARWIERFEREGRDVYDKRHEVVAACRLKPGMTVADVGAGSGLFTLLFAAAVGPTGHVFAVDISDEFVKAITERAAAQGVSNVTGIVCTAEDTKLPADRVDVLFICDTYHHFEFPQKTLASIHKAMKPRGQLILVEFHRIDGVSSDWAMEHIRAGKEVFAKEIEQAGFRLLEDKPMFQEKYFLRFQRLDNGRADGQP